MKKSLNKTLLTAIVAAVLAFACAIVSFGYANKNVANAEETLTVPTTYTGALETDFYVYDGAAVRLESSGIAFKSYVTEAFHDQISANGTKTVTYFATANAVGKKAMALKFPIQPSFDDQTTFELKTYINFLSLESDAAAAKSAYAKDFATATWAKVDNGDGTYDYYKAYFKQDASGNTDIVRSMRAVGNEAYLQGETGAAKYFGTATRSEEVTAYLTNDAYHTTYVKMPGLTNTEDSVEVYVGAEKYTASYDSARDVYSFMSDSVDVDGVSTSENVSIFVGSNNDVYSTKIANATVVGETELTALRAQDTATGYYVLSSDVFCMDALPVSTLTFSGVFDGLGHTITAKFNGNSAAQNNGLFKVLGDGAKVKNLNIVCEALANNSGVLTYTTSNGANTYIENVYIDLAANSFGGAPVADINQGVMNVKDTVIYVRSLAQQEAGSNGSKFVWNNNYAAGTNYRNDIKINADNVHVIYRSISDVTEVTRNSSNDSRIFGDVTTYRYLGSFYRAVKEEKASLPKGIGSALESSAYANVKFLNNSNITDFYTTEGGEVILTEDIDLTGITWEDPFAGTSTSYKNNNLTFDGAGYSVKNITLPNATYRGFFSSVAGTSIILNANFEFDSFGNNYQGLISQNRGNTTIYNVGIISNAAVRYASGLVCVMTSFPVTVKNSAIIYNATGVPDTNGGILASSINASTATLTLDGVAIFNRSTSDKLIHSSTDGILTIEGTADVDYVHVKTSGDILDIDASKYTEAKIKAAVERARELEKANAVAVTKDNISVLQTATSGYYYLAEDIDMSGVTYAGAQTATAPFSGTLNGMGHKIYNFTAPSTRGGLFEYANGATVKNLNYHVVTNTAKGALFGYINKIGTTVTTTTVENVNITIDNLVSANYTGPIANVVQNNLTVKDVNIVIKGATVTGVAYSGFISGGEASNVNITVSNVNCYDASGKFTVPYSPSTPGYGCVGTDGAAAVAGEDYVYYGDSEAFGNDYVAGKLNAQFKAMIDELGLVKAITAANFTEIGSATAGYLYLT